MNQCRMVVGYHLCRSPRGELNGEDTLAATVAPQVSTFLDVGANVGRWSMTLLSKTPTPAAVRGIAIEPNVELLPQLTSNLAPYPNVRVLQSAVGAARGTADFFLSVGSSELGTLWGSQAESREKVRVEVRTIDDLIAEAALAPIDFLKIDTEGNDFEVLLGARQTISKQSAHVIQFEYGPNWRRAGHTLWRAISFFDEHSYKVFRIAPEGLVAFNRDDYPELFTYSNFAALSAVGRGYCKEIIDSRNGLA